MFRISRSKFGRGALVACALLTALGSSSAAHAAPGSRTRVFVSGGVQVGGSCGPRVVQPACAPQRVIVHGDTCSCDSCGRQREYQRGVVRAETRAANAGYRDGLSGARPCDAPRDELCDNSRWYREGYLAAYPKAYRCAYERGQSERARDCRPTYRPRCP